MPWKHVAQSCAYRAFIEAVLRRESCFSVVCREHGISRQSGYKWWRRFVERGKAGLREESRRPRRLGRGWPEAMREAVRRLRRQHPTWGAKKLRWALGQSWPQRQLPHVRTLGRWHPRAAGCPRRQSLWQAAPPRRTARHCHAVWTIDFKGWFRTGDGRRCEPLTVRDAYSRCVLHCAHVSAQSDQAVRLALRRVFREHGLPKVIRVDNGPPFGGVGALGLSTLSTWWLRLGIGVEFSRPAHPEDNGAHEQMHRVLKAETATPPAASLQAQHRRLQRWRRHYNHTRPHEALGQQPPARRYRTNSRRWPLVLPVWTYPSTDTIRRVNSRGFISWRGRLRFVGRAFARHLLGLRHRRQHWAVYLGPHQLGILFPNDHGGLRPIRLLPFSSRSTTGEEPSPSP